ncbi:hypothetical protein L0F63_004226 [Massospora cicadina]|nr:hypothetical protein L0F63_004226 [Massospora cicadina]
MSDRGSKLRRCSTNVSDPCKLRVLVVPVGPIARREFYKYIGLISEFAIVEVDQLLKSPHPLRARLARFLYPRGRIHINFVTEHHPGHVALEEVQYFRRVLGVLGILDCEQCDALEECHDKFLLRSRKVRAEYGTKTGVEVATSVSQRCFAFRAKEGRNIAGVTMVPERADMGFYLQLSMVEFISQIVSFCCEEAERILASDSCPSLSGWHLTPTINSTPKAHFRNPSIPKELSRVYDLASAVKLGMDLKGNRLSLGRQAKLAADLYLMSGRFPDAAKMYLKAIDGTRTNGDNVFYLCSLEGYYCTMLLISSINEDPADFSYRGDPGELLGTIADSYTNELIKLYESTGYPLLYIEAYLKLAKLLTVVWKLGICKPAIDACIGDDFDTIEATAPVPLGTRRRVSRPCIASWVMRAWGPAINHLAASDKVSILSAMAAIFGSLGYTRKQAFFLRQYVSLLVPKFGQGPPALTESEATLRGCLSWVSQGYQIGTNPVDPTNPQPKGLRYADVYPHHRGWVDLQKCVYKECVTLSEAISGTGYWISRLIVDFSAAGRYTALTLLHLYPHLTNAEQEECAQTLLYLAQCHALQLSQSDLSFTLPHLVSPSGFRIETSRELYPLETMSPKGSNPTPMFNFKREAPVQKAELLVVGEAAQMELELTNPFRFALELDNLLLRVEGVEIRQSAASCTVPPKGRISWRSTLTPLCSGTLRVVGLQMRILGCMQQLFTWPALTQEVLSRQPLLKIARASLAQPSLMLFEGERATFTLTLANVGPVSANLVQVELGEPASIAWTNPSMGCIQPEEELTLTFEAFGMPPRQATVTINYAHGQDGGGANCRKKSYHVNLSVYPALTPVDFDALNGSEAAMALVPSHLTQHLSTSGVIDLQRQFCLVALGVRNPTTSLVKVTFEVLLDPSVARHVITETLAPLETKRVFIPFRRLTVDREAMEMGTLGQSLKRQLLEQLSASWQIDTRHGDLSLHWMGIPEPLWPILQMEEVWLSTSLLADGRPVRLAVVLNNSRRTPITPCLRIQPYLDYHNGHFVALAPPSPTTLAPATPLVVLGRSQEIFSEVPPHSSTQYTFILLPSGTGQFRIGCCCQDLSDLLAPKGPPPSQAIASAPLFLDVAPLVVDIVDPPPS